MARILVADDEPHARRVLELRLIGAGHDVTLASDGLEALETLREGAFDVLVTDICMPRMTGRELIDALRSLDAPFPIVFVLTSKVEDEFRDWLRDYDDLAFMEKPVSLRQLIAEIEQRLSDRKAEDADPEPSV